MFFGKGSFKMANLQNLYTACCWPPCSYSYWPECNHPDLCFCSQNNWKPLVPAKASCIREVPLLMNDSAYHVKQKSPGNVIKTMWSKQYILWLQTMMPTEPAEWGFLPKRVCENRWGFKVAATQEDRRLQLNVCNEAGKNVCSWWPSWWNLTTGQAWNSQFFWIMICCLV